MEKLFLRVLDMSLVSALVIAAVLLLRLPLKRAPKSLSCLLWLAVLLRLLCPLAPESPLSLIPARMEAVTQSLAPASAAPVGAVTEPAAPEEAESPAPAAPERGWSWLSLAARLWPLGTAALLMGGGISLLRLRRRVAGAVPVGDKVYLAGNIPTAFVLGLLRPRIYLPASLDGRERDFVLLHERAHLRRRDPLFRLLAFLALALHWFNPLVWLAFVLSGRDMEMACDEAVLRRVGEDSRADYGQTLLDQSAGRRVSPAVPLAFGRGDTGTRVKNALRWKKPALWVSVTGALLVALAGVLLLTNPLSSGGSTVTVRFPAYQDGRADVFEPFTVSLALPEGWTVALPPEEERETDAGRMLDTPVYLYDETGAYAGLMGWGDFEPYTGDDVDSENYYQTVYAPMRLGAHYFWYDFVSAARTQTGEAHTFSVYYQEPVEGVSAAEWPPREALGLCRYDTEKGLYVAVQLEKGTVTREQQTAMAESLRIG